MGNLMSVFVLGSSIELSLYSFSVYTIYDI